MAKKGKPTGSVFFNAAAWLFLFLMLAAGIAALFSAAGGIAQTVKLANVEIQTTSVAVVVMFLTAVPLLLILRYALSGKIMLYERTAEPTLIEDYSGPLQLIAVAVAVTAAIVMLW